MMFSLFCRCQSIRTIDSIQRIVSYRYFPGQKLVTSTFTTTTTATRTGSGTSSNPVASLPVVVDVCRNFYSTTSKSVSTTGGGRQSFSFQQIYRNRKAEARCSVLIQVANKLSCNELYRICQNVGTIKKMYYGSNRKDYVLVEFNDESSVETLLSQATHFPDTAKVPCRTRMLYFGRPKIDNHSTLSVTAPVEFEANKGCDMTALQHATSVTGQINLYYQSERQTEMGTRLRYFLCTLLEDAFRGLFPGVEVFPFGSSASGLARHNSDLDIILSLGQQNSNAKADSNLRFMTRKLHPDENHNKQFTKRTLDVIANTLDLFLPQYEQVQSILNARVPIVNFKHDATNITCDLSLNNRSGILMSEVLFTLCQLDSRFRSLLFILRKWASNKGLTLTRPGPRFSNFMLGCLVIHFLQTRPVPILPPLNRIISKDNEILTEYWTLPKSENQEDLGELLLGFYEYFANFPFHNQAISLLDGVKTFKQERTFQGDMFVENPLDSSHNVTQNVRLKELQYLKACLNTAYQQLGNTWECSDHPWGIIPLLQQEFFVKDIHLGVRAKDLFATMRNKLEDSL
ncbi:poly(A) RNA polymerase, mitochondrial-like [Tubulanus polymorphus]|uniref:poly(A) RNA polymerase, mitochondrial-like n=1 Tax=Tubulanus polymorphus TaxID=672921 RepID=UPI003DA279F1